MAQANKGGTKKPNVFIRLGAYFKDVRVEMKRVVWPTRDDVVKRSGIVIVTLAFFIALTLVVDSLSSWLIIDLLGQIGR